MKHIFSVARHEIITTLERPSFWFTTIVFPVLILALSFGNSIIGSQAIEESEAAAREMAMEVTTTSIGYVDLAGVIQTIPPEIPPGLLRSYPTEQDAQADMAAGILRQYYLIPEDFYGSGDIILVDKNYQPVMSESSSNFFQELVLANLAEQTKFGRVLYNPTYSILNHAITPQETTLDTFSAEGSIIPLAVMFILFFVITNSGSFMLQSVVKEKENRTAEILLTSLQARELMAGKVIGLGIIALVQMMIWMSGSLFALNRSTSLVQNLAGYTLPAGFIPLVLVYFILGFFVYGAALGAIGALAPNTREAGQFTFIVLIPLLLPLWFNSAFTADSNGMVATIFSIFPLTAPAAMVSRLVQGGVPAWQIAVSLAGLAITAYFFVAVAARLFRADTLLSTTSLTWKRLWAEVRGRPTS